MAQRMTRLQLVGAALASLVGLYALGAAVTWLGAMLAERAAWFVLMSVLAMLGALAMVLAAPVNHLWRRQPRPARLALAALTGVGGVCAAVCLWFVALLNACEGICRPVHTWLMLPALVSCGALCGLGPAWGALGLRGREGSGRWWALAVVAGILGSCVALFCWVEMGLYPNS